MFLLTLLSCLTLVLHTLRRGGLVQQELALSWRSALVSKMDKFVDDEHPLR